MVEHGSAGPEDGTIEGFVCWVHEIDRMTKDEAVEHFTSEHDMDEEEVREELKELRDFDEDW